MSLYSFIPAMAGVAACSDGKPSPMPWCAPIACGIEGRHGAQYGAFVCALQTRVALPGAS